jgi:hypothetical protein
VASGAQIGQAQLFDLMGQCFFKRRPFGILDVADSPSTWSVREFVDERSRSQVGERHLEQIRLTLHCSNLKVGRFFEILRVVNWVEIEIANTLFPFLAFSIL